MIPFLRNLWLLLTVSCLFFLSGCVTTPIDEQSQVRLEVGHRVEPAANIRDYKVYGSTSTVFRTGDNIAFFVTIPGSYNGERMSVDLIDKDTGESYPVIDDVVETGGPRYGKVWTQNITLAVENKARLVARLSVGPTVRERHFILVPAQTVEPPSEDNQATPPLQIPNWERATKEHAQITPIESNIDEFAVIKFYGHLTQTEKRGELEVKEYYPFAKFIMCDRVEDFNQDGKIKLPDEYVGIKNKFKKNEGFLIVSIWQGFKDKDVKIILQSPSKNEIFSETFTIPDDIFSWSKSFAAGSLIEIGSHQFLWYIGDDLIMRYEFVISQ